MSEISDAIQSKCLAFGDRIIKLNDYLLEQASQKYDVRSKKEDVRGGLYPMGKVRCLCPCDEERDCQLERVC